MAIIDRGISQDSNYHKMVDDKKMSGSPGSPGFSDLESLKKRIDIMYKYRNNKKKDVIKDKNDKDLIIENLCRTHNYTSFEDYQKQHEISFSLSTGDIDDALDALTNCSCNGRQLTECECVQRSSGNYCQCNSRYIYNCNCVYRSGGKYNPRCYCDARNSGCGCVSRTPEVSCSCNGRCSCNIVNEYTFEEERTTCSCVSRELCNFCECYGRTPPTVSSPGNRGYCDRHEYRETGRCQCVQRTSSALCEAHVVHYSPVNTIDV